MVLSNLAARSYPLLISDYSVYRQHMYILDDLQEPRKVNANQAGSHTSVHKILYGSDAILALSAPQSSNPCMPPLHLQGSTKDARQGQGATRQMKGT